MGFLLQNRETESSDLWNLIAAKWSLSTEEDSVISKHQTSGFEQTEKIST